MEFLKIKENEFDDSPVISYIYLNAEDVKLVEPGESPAVTSYLTLKNHEKIEVIGSEADVKAKLQLRTRGFEVVKDFARKFPDQEIKLPQRGTSKAMAYDFFANADYDIEPGKIAKVWTDVKAYMGDTEALVLNVRSSMGGKFMLANTSGWVDSDYYSNEGNDGNIGVFLLNISDEVQHIKAGEKVAQGMFINFLVADNGNVDTERTGGFGSTGK